MELSAELYLKRTDDPFIRLPRATMDEKRLSWKAKGILAYILGKKDGWQVRVKDLMNRSTDGESAIRAAIWELRETGYARLEATRENGRVSKWVLKVSDTPSFEPEHRKSPDSENHNLVQGGGEKPHVENPHVENHHPSKTEAISKKPDRENKDGADALVGGDPEAETFFEAWNREAEEHGFTKCVVVSNTRKRNLRSRLKDKFFRDNWRDGLQKAKALDWCMGRTERGWKINVDFFLRPGSLAKIIEATPSSKATAAKRNPIADAGPATPREDVRAQYSVNTPEHMAEFEKWEREEQERKRKQQEALNAI